MRQSMTRQKVLARGVWLSGALMAAPAAIGCGTGGTGEAGKTITAGTPRPAGTISPASLMFTTWGVHPLPEGVATEKSVEVFQAANPKIKVTIEAVPNAPIDAILVKVRAMVAAGAPPDVTLMRPHYIAALHQSNALQTIDPFLSRERELSRASYFKPALERLIFENKLYGLPSDFWFTATYYNRELFEAAGVRVPDGDWTWDTFLDAAKKLTTGSGTERRHGAQVPPWQARVRDSGGDILDAKEMTCLLDQAPAVDGIQWTADLTLKQQVVPTADELREQNAQDRFLNGRLAMFPQGNWFQGVPASRASFRWDLAPLPKGKAGRRPLAGGANFCIPTGVKAPEASWLFLKFIGGTEGATIRGKEAGLFPGMPAVAKPEVIPAFSAVQIRNILDSAQDARPEPFVPRYAEMSALINRELAPVWRGEASAKEATAKLVPLVNQLLKGT